MVVGWFSLGREDDLRKSFTERGGYRFGWGRESFTPWEVVVWRDRERKSFKSLRWAIRGDKKRRVLRAWEGLFEGIERESFESVREAVWRDRERRVLRAWEGLFEGIDASIFLERRAVVGKDW